MRLTRKPESSSWRRDLGAAGVDSLGGHVLVGVQLFPLADAVLGRPLLTAAKVEHLVGDDVPLELLPVISRLLQGLDLSFLVSIGPGTPCFGQTYVDVRPDP